jgi:hypothetical protein
VGGDVPQNDDGPVDLAPLRQVGLHLAGESRL